jgi:hypothetical protein
MRRITADMLPEECGSVIKGFFAMLFPEGQTVEELKQSPHRLFRDIGKYFECKEVEEHGHELL